FAPFAGDEGGRAEAEEGHRGGLGDAFGDDAVFVHGNGGGAFYGEGVSVGRNPEVFLGLPAATVTGVVGGPAAEEGVGVVEAVIGDDDAEDLFVEGDGAVIVLGAVTGGVEVDHVAADKGSGGDGASVEVAVV